MNQEAKKLSTLALTCEQVKGTVLHDPAQQDLAQAVLDAGPAMTLVAGALVLLEDGSDLPELARLNACAALVGPVLLSIYQGIDGLLNPVEVHSDEEAADLDLPELEEP